MLRLKRENEELVRRIFSLKKAAAFLQRKSIRGLSTIEQYHNEFGIRWRLTAGYMPKMLITIARNTGRRIIIPLKPKSKHRFRKYIIRTMELTAIE